MSNKTDYLEAAQLNWMRGTTFPSAPSAVYLALFTGSASEDGITTMPEIPTSLGYQRQLLTFSAVTQSAGVGVISSSNGQTFGPASSSWGSVSHIGLFDAQTSGNMLYFNSSSVAQNVAAGDRAVFNTGSIIVRER